MSKEIFTLNRINYLPDGVGGSIKVKTPIKKIYGTIDEKFSTSQVSNEKINYKKEFIVVVGLYTGKKIKELLNTNRFTIEHHSGEMDVEDIIVENKKLAKIKCYKYM